jgi:hypothetical protein
MASIGTSERIMEKVRAEARREIFVLKKTWRRIKSIRATVRTRAWMGVVSAVFFAKAQS